MIVKANIGDRIAFEILYDFHLLKNSYQILYDSLPDVKKKAEIEMNDTLKKIDPENYEMESSLYYSNYYSIYEEELPNRISYSFVMSVFSSVEYNIKKLCENIKSQKDLPIQLDALSGKLSERLNNYLKIFKISIIEPSDLQHINELTMVRNCIAHNNGSIIEYRKFEKQSASVKLTRFCKAKKNIEIMDNKLLIQKDFCFFYLDYFEKMFKRWLIALNYKL